MMRTRAMRRWWPVAAMASAGLVACAAPQDDLNGWMQQTRASAPRTVTPIEKPKQFEPFIYEATSDTDPFSDAKLQQALARLVQSKPGAVRPDEHRKRDPLEAFPVEEIAMVGQMTRKSTGAVALLRVGTTVYQARVGQYVGQNHGRIVAISDSRVQLKELVQDGAGEWIQRDASLQIQEAMK